MATCRALTGLGASDAIDEVPAPYAQPALTSARHS